MARSAGKMGSSGCVRCTVRYASQKAVPAPATVTPWRRSTSTVGAGSNASTTIAAAPVMSRLKSVAIPPTCVNGNTRPNRSPGTRSSARFTPRALAPTVTSVCFAPLGSAVVPDV